MRQKESFFLISIKRPRASLRGGGAVLSLALCKYACSGEGAAVRNFFHLIGTRAINMYVRMKHHCKA